jgi:hypothetical protein
MLGSMRERRIGNKKLGDNMMMLMAMNPPTTGADPHETSLPFANRVTWLPFPDVTDEEHLAFMNGRLGGASTGEGSSPWGDGPIVVDPALHRAALREVLAIHAGFLRVWAPEDSDPDRTFVRENPERDDVLSRTPLAYCTPRSVDMALLMAATCRMFGDLTAMADLVVGTIGKPRGLAWMGYYENNDMLDPETVLADISTFTHDPMRPDRTFVQVRSVAMAACSNDFPEAVAIQRWHQGWRLIQRLMAEGVSKGIVLVSGQYMGEHKPKGAVLREVMPIIQELSPMVTAAGV